MKRRLSRILAAASLALLAGGELLAQADGDVRAPALPGSRAGLARADALPAAVAAVNDPVCLRCHWCPMRQEGADAPSRTSPSPPR